MNRRPLGARGCRRRGYGMPGRGMIGVKQAKKRVRSKQESKEGGRGERNVGR